MEFMNDIKKILAFVEIQENGIIRNKNGHLVGRLRNDLEFSDKQVQDAQFLLGSASSLPDPITTRLNRLERMVIMQGITITVLVVTMLLVAWG